MNNLDKAARIRKEELKLRKIYRDLPKDALDLYDGLIIRAAYMRVTMEDYETDLDQRGYVEMFTQSVQTAPYERERPVARLYNAMGKNYMSIIKQLSDLLPDTDEAGSDELMAFFRGD